MWRSDRETLPLFRGLASDLSFTSALAIITMVTAQVWAIRTHGFFGNLGRYFVNPFTNPMGFSEGLLELLAEFESLLRGIETGLESAELGGRRLTDQELFLEAKRALNPLCPDYRRYRRAEELLEFTSARQQITDISIVDETGQHRVVPGQVDVWVGGGQPVSRKDLTPAAGMKARFAISSGATLPD